VEARVELQLHIVVQEATNGRPPCLFAGCPQKLATATSSATTLLQLLQTTHVFTVYVRCFWQCARQYKTTQLVLQPCSLDTMPRSSITPASAWLML
jgi:hypothetical protein